MSLKKIIETLKQLSDPEIFFGRDESGNKHSGTDDSVNGDRSSDDSCSDDRSRDDSFSDDRSRDDSCSDDRSRDDSCNDDRSSDICDNDDRGSEKVGRDKRASGRRFFCYEDTFSTKDLNIEVEDVGKLTFPLDENCIEKMIKISSKAKFGSGEETVLDTTIRDTQKIPAEKLKVTINEKALSCVLERIGSGLNIDKDCTIEPYLHNLLIYGPGQFFKKHRDSEKLTNMIATLVIVLPSKHKGGDLIIEHNKQMHVFFGSQNFDFVKCIAFYSDCQHEIEKVIEGYRVALTYNVVLKSSRIVDTVAITESLANAVAKYFAKSENPRLIFLLNHCYSEHSLNWNLLKGTDRTYAHALFAVAKKQDRIPFLALAKYHENKESKIYSEFPNDEVYDSSTSLYFWIDESNLKLDKSAIDTKSRSLEVCDDSEICYTFETPKLFKAYKTEESGPTGNEGATCDYWYRRACVVIFSSKWLLPNSYTGALNELYQLTTSEGNESNLQVEIDKAGDDFLQPSFWKDSSIVEKLLKIVMYLNSSKNAVLILSHLAKQILTDERIEVLIQLELQYDVETWAKILKNWEGKDISCSVAFIKNYISLSKNKIVLKFVLKEIIDKFLNKRNYCITIHRIQSTLIIQSAQVIFLLLNRQRMSWLIC